MEKSQQRDLEFFVDLFGEFRNMPLEFGDKPDMVIENGHERLGVEHTRLYVEQPGLPSGRQLKPQEGIHFKIAQRAFELFRDKLSIPLYLTVDFEEPYNYRERDVETVAADLSLAVQQSLSLNPHSLTGQDTWVYAWQFKHFGYTFPPGVSSFHYAVVEPHRGFELWGPVCSYFVPHLSIRDIEARIEKKEDLLQTYLKRCDRCWLLIATDAGWRSSHFDIPSEVVEHSYATRFERVFLMAITHRTLIPLKIT